MTGRPTSADEPPADRPGQPGPTGADVTDTASAPTNRPTNRPASEPESGPDPARALLARSRAAARAAPRPGARRRRRPGDRTTDTTARSAAGPDERDPKPFAAALERLTAEHGWELDVSVHAVLARWPDLVGPELAEHCHPEGFTDGVLTVRAESSAWATQLHYLAPQLVARLNAQVGSGTVRSVTVRGPDAPRWSHGRRSVPGRGPRDTYG